jgi:flagellar biosynthesis/type III secretory pathway chaperone
MDALIKSPRGEMEVTNVDSAMQQLVELVQKEVETFQALLDSMESEQKALIAQDVSGIEKTVISQRELAVNAAALERARTKLVVELSQELGETASDLTLKSLIDRIEGEHSKHLGEMRETLIAMHEKIQNANKQNALLIKQSMKYVDKSLQILAGDGPETGVYARSGKVSKSGRTVLNEVV